MYHNTQNETLQMHKQTHFYASKQTLAYRLLTEYIGNNETHRGSEPIILIMYIKGHMVSLKIKKLKEYTVKSLNTFQVFNQRLIKNI